MLKVHSTTAALSVTFLVAAMISLAPSIAGAQDTEPTVALEEIVVVARKREEKLQDVPISISAFSAQAIRDRNIQNSYDLANFTPNFNFTPNLGRRLDVPNIRGQFGPLNASTPPNASFFVDGVFVTGSIASTSLANLERAEILRGPQSAVFGRATFSGAINYITRKPTDEYAGQVNARYGEDGDTELGAWVSGPIPAGESVFKDTLFFFAGLSWDEWDGQWNNGLEPGQVDATQQFPSFGAQIWDIDDRDEAGVFERSTDPATGPAAGLAVRIVIQVRTHVVAVVAVVVLCRRNEPVGVVAVFRVDEFSLEVEFQAVHRSIGQLQCADLGLLAAELSVITDRVRATWRGPRR